MIHAWRWLRAWLSNQTTPALLVVDLEARIAELVQARQERQAQHEAEVYRLRADVSALRREAVAVDAASQAVIAQNQRERVWSNQLAHRIAAAHQFAEQLPAEQAAELRALLAPKLPTTQEAARAHL